MPPQIGTKMTICVHFKYFQIFFKSFQHLLFHTNETNIAWLDSARLETMLCHRKRVLYCSSVKSEGSIGNISVFTPLLIEDDDGGGNVGSVQCLPLKARASNAGICKTYGPQTGFS